MKEPKQEMQLPLVLASNKEKYVNHQLKRRNICRVISVYIFHQHSWKDLSDLIAETCSLSVALSSSVTC